MGLKVALNLFRTMFGKSAKTVAAHAPAPQRMTRTLTDPITGAITGLERNITRNGEEALARLEYLPNGSTKMTIFNKDGFAPVWRTKTVTREKGSSVFGGDKVTVEKDYTKYWCYCEKTKLTKEYNKAGSLEHKELDYYKNYGNETFIKHTASQDKVYAEHPLTSGSKDMLKDPYKSQYIQHAVDDKNNYGHFVQKETNYERIVAEKKQAAIDAAKKAEQEAAAAIKAEQEAAEKLAASRPKVNTGKISNKNIEEFKCVEQITTNGSIVRRYFDPYASNGKSNPMIKTIDKGNYHEEIIYDPRKDIKVIYKQLGRKEPEIEMFKGHKFRYTSKYDPRTDYRSNIQYYNDGQNIVESIEGGYFPKNIVVKNPHSPELQALLGESDNITNCYRNLTDEQKKALNKRFDEIKQEMAHNEVDLMDLFRTYKP